MIKNLGIIFSGLLILLLLSNIHYNTGIQVLGQNTSSTNNNSETDTAASQSTISGATAASSSIAKLEGGVKIISPDKGDFVPLNSNKSLVVSGVSKDNATSNCDVTIIVNNVKPYQNVQPTGTQGNNDYSTWQYTLSSNYTKINEGNNKITSKIFCTGIDGTQPSSSSSAQAYYSVNVTASNFTQAQLTNYELMLASAANATNGNGNGSAVGNSTLASNAIMPVAQIQQFNQDTGNGPVCCTAVSGTPGQAIGSTTPTAAILAQDTEVATTDDEEEVEEERNEEEVEEERNEEDDSNRNDEEEDDSNRNDEEDNNDNNDDSGGDIMDDVEDTIRDSGIDFSFD